MFSAAPIFRSLFLVHIAFLSDPRTSVHFLGGRAPQPSIGLTRSQSHSIALKKKCRCKLAQGCASFGKLRQASTSFDKLRQASTSFDKAEVFSRAVFLRPPNASSL